MFIQVYNMLFIEINETNFSVKHGLAVLKILITNFFMKTKINCCNLFYYFITIVIIMI